MSKSYQLRNALHPLMKTHSRIAFLKSPYDIFLTNLSKPEKSQTRGKLAIKSLYHPQNSVLQIYPCKPPFSSEHGKSLPSSFLLCRNQTCSHKVLSHFLERIFSKASVKQFFRKPLKAENYFQVIITRS